MRFHDGAADTKSHACAITLGGKERIKYLVRLLRRQTHAGIADRDHQLRAFGALRLDRKLARPGHILHRFDTINHEVHQHLLQLHAVGHNPGKICSKVCFE